MKNSNLRMKGAAMVEFSLVAILFFVILFSIIEFGRLIFAWNTLGQVARRGARLAAVCPPNHEDIKYGAVFGIPNSNSEGTLLNDLTTANVQITYWNKNDASIDPATSSGMTALLDNGYVVAEIINYTHQLIIPTFSLTLTAPSFRTVLPVEALGIVKGSGVNLCPFPP